MKPCSIPREGGGWMGEATPQLLSPGLHSGGGGGRCRCGELPVTLRLSLHPSHVRVVHRRQICERVLQETAPAWCQSSTHFG